MEGPPEGRLLDQEIVHQELATEVDGDYGGGEWR
jgi:hypothetical protein